MQPRKTHSERERTTVDPTIELVHDPRATPPRVALFDAADVDRWIRTNEDHLTDLTTIR